MAPSFFNANPDVRLVSVEVALAMYRIVGQEVKQLVHEIDGLKANLMQTISKRMNQMDMGGKQYLTGSIVDPNKSGIELE